MEKNVVSHQSDKVSLTRRVRNHRGLGHLPSPRRLKWQAHVHTTNRANQADTGQIATNPQFALVAEKMENFFLVLCFLHVLSRLS